VAKHHVINYETFLPKLVSGLRQAWQEARRRRPRETFYIFGIATDSDVVVLTPFWNTEEKYAREGKPEYPADKWIVPEEGYGPCKYTAALQDEVNRYVFEDHTAEPDSVFEKRQARLLKIFEQALVQLDQEGVFGKGKERDRILLLIDRGDCSEDETKYMYQVIKRINPPRSRGPYFAALKEQKRKDADRELEKERAAKRVQTLATAFLRKEKRSFERFDKAYRVENEAVIPHLAKLLSGKRKPDELWEAYFDAKDEPNGRMHGPGMICVVVDPEAGNCAIEP
jgi:hypothetical protein